MKRWSLLLCIFLLCMPVHAEEPAVSAKSAIVLEYHTGKVLYAKNAETPLPMASTTKIMTALLALEKASLTDTVTIGANAAGVEGSSMYLKIGETLSMEELLCGLMLSSGNDAAVAIAEHIAGNEKAFANMMTERAKELGCENTQFQNASGLPDDAHFTTALELARITGKALENGKFREIVGKKSAKAGGRTLSNHNKMLSLYDGAIGVKTGFTKAAGRTLVSAAVRDGVELICVTLNAPDDWTDHTHLLDYGFSQMERRQITWAGTAAGHVPVSGGTAESVGVCFAEDACLSVLPTDKIEVKSSLPDNVSAPVQKGERLGTAEILVEGVKMGEVALLADAEVEHVPSRTFWDYVYCVFKAWANLYL